MSAQFTPLPEFLTTNGIQPMDFLVAHLRAEAPPVVKVGDGTYVPCDEGEIWLNRLKARAMLREAGLTVRG